MAKINKNAFTIVELLVAMALLVILLGLSGLVFNTSVKAFRAGSATVEMTRNLRALTEQLSSDFQGLQADAPLFIAFNYDSADDRHYDTIHFFANGDFQTTGQYNVRYDSDYDGTLEPTDNLRLETISGNLARIYYGHANSVDLIADPTATPDFGTYRVLSRKSHILTSHEGVVYEFGQIPLITNGSGDLDYTQFAGDFGGAAENLLEFNTITLTNWINALNFNTNNADTFITNCMTDAARPMIDISNPATLHLLMSQGLISMQIQWAYTYDDLDDPTPASLGYFEGVRWWPSMDPAGDGDDGEVGDGTDIDDFTTMASQFGVHYNLTASSVAGWLLSQNCLTDYNGTVMNFADAFYPKALKFKVLVKDAKGVFNDGKTFTHIVYIGD